MESIYEIKFGNTQFFYRLRRSNRKRSIGISVDPIEGVIIIAPAKLSPPYVHQAVSRRASWIVSKLRALHEFSSQARIREFVSGESFSYLGRNYRLKIIPSVEAEPSVRLLHGRFEIRIDSQTSVSMRREIARAELSRWYQKHAAIRIPERVTVLSLRLGITAPQILIRDQQRRWASCDRKGKIRFNWRIIMAPRSLVDYVVAHELCHLIHRDHSSGFWKLLRTIVPDYYIRRERLRNDGQRFLF